MKRALFLVASASLVFAPFAPASAPARGCVEECCTESRNCCTDACPCPVTCVLPAPTTALVPPVTLLPVLEAAPRHVPPPADEWAAALPQRPPVPPPRA